MALPPNPWRSGHVGATEPRLCAFVHHREIRGGGVILLSAALWGGFHERAVPLSPEQADQLASELQAHAVAVRRAQARSRGAVGDTLGGGEASGVRVAGGPRAEPGEHRETHAAVLRASRGAEGYPRSRRVCPGLPVESPE